MKMGNGTPLKKHNHVVGLDSPDASIVVDIIEPPHQPLLLPAMSPRQIDIHVARKVAFTFYPSFYGNDPHSLAPAHVCEAYKSR